MNEDQHLRQTQIVSSSSCGECLMGFVFKLNVYVSLTDTMGTGSCLLLLFAACLQSSWGWTTSVNCLVTLGVTLIFALPLNMPRIAPSTPSCSGQIRFVKRSPTSCFITLTISYEVPNVLAPFANVRGAYCSVVESAAWT